MLEAQATPIRDGSVEKRVACLDVGRVLAALGIFYSHLDVLWLRRDHHITTPFTNGLATFVTGPLHITNQGIGQIGVPIFFLISGYVMPSLALRLGGTKFIANRLLRIYPMMAVTVCLSAGLIVRGVPILQTGQLRDVTLTTVLTNIALVNYLIFPQVVLVGVAWTLVIEVISYSLLLLVLPVLCRSVWLGLALELGIAGTVLATQSNYGPTWSLLAVNMSHVPAVIIGQVIWAIHRRLLNRWVGASLLCACWFVFVWGDLKDSGRPDHSYPLCLMLAALIFCVGLLAEREVAYRRVWSALSERTYSLYLLHGVVAFPMIDLLARRLPLVVAMGLAVCFTFAVVEVAYRLVERPSHRWGRAVSSRTRTSAVRIDAREPVTAGTSSPSRLDRR